MNIKKNDKSNEKIINFEDRGNLLLENIKNEYGNDKKKSINFFENIKMYEYSNNLLMLSIVSGGFMGMLIVYCIPIKHKNIR